MDGSLCFKNPRTNVLFSLVGRESQELTLLIIFMCQIIYLTWMWVTVFSPARTVIQEPPTTDQTEQQQEYRFNAIERSRRISKDTLPLLRAFLKSSSKAVSMPWPGQKLHWKRSRHSISSRIWILTIWSSSQPYLDIQYISKLKAIWLCIWYIWFMMHTANWQPVSHVFCGSQVGLKNWSCLLPS